MKASYPEDRWNATCVTGPCTGWKTAVLTYAMPNQTVSVSHRVCVQPVRNPAPIACRSLLVHDLLREGLLTEEKI